MIIVDTGVLYALADRRDRHHPACVRWLSAARGPLVVLPTVTAEACYLIGRHLGVPAEAAFLDALGPGRTFELSDLVSADVVRMAELVRQYSGFPLGGTDASVIAVAERLGVVEVATVDRRHFSAVRPSHVDSFRLPPAGLRPTEVSVSVDRTQDGVWVRVPTVQVEGGSYPLEAAMQPS